MRPPCGSFSTAVIGSCSRVTRSIHGILETGQIIFRWNARRESAGEALPTHHPLVPALACDVLVEHPRSSWPFPVTRSERVAGSWRHGSYHRRSMQVGAPAAQVHRFSLWDASLQRGRCASLTAVAARASAGRRPDGMAWTAVAQAYPPALCKALAGLFAAEARAHLLALTAVRD